MIAINRLGGGKRLDFDVTTQTGIAGEAVTKGQPVFLLREAGADIYKEARSLDQGHSSRLSVIRGNTVAYAHDDSQVYVETWVLTGSEYHVERNSVMLPLEGKYRLAAMDLAQDAQYLAVLARQDIDPEAIEEPMGQLMLFNRVANAGESFHYDLARSIQYPLSNDYWEHKLVNLYFSPSGRQLILHDCASEQYNGMVFDIVSDPWGITLAGNTHVLELWGSDRAAIAFSHDDQYLLVCGGNDVQHAVIYRRYADMGIYLQHGVISSPQYLPITAIALTPDDRYVLMMEEGNPLCIWIFENHDGSFIGPKKAIMGEQLREVVRVAFSHDAAFMLGIPARGMPMLFKRVQESDGAYTYENIAFPGGMNVEDDLAASFAANDDILMLPQWSDSLYLYEQVKPFVWSAQSAQHLIDNWPGAKLGYAQDDAAQGERTDVSVVFSLPEV